MTSFDVLASNGAFLPSVPAGAHVAGFRVRDTLVVAVRETDLGEPTGCGCEIVGP